MVSGIDVLHVDDNAAFRDLTAEFLERSAAPITVLSEADPGAVLDRVEDESVDCVVSDLEMPQQSGIDLCEAVRDEHPELPFLLFTNRTGESVVTAALAAGATDYVQKQPGAHHYDLLANRIVHAVTRHRAFTRLDRYDVRGGRRRRPSSVDVRLARDGAAESDHAVGNTQDLQ